MGLQIPCHTLANKNSKWGRCWLTMMGRSRKRGEGNRANKLANKKWLSLQNEDDVDWQLTMMGRRGRGGEVIEPTGSSTNQSLPWRENPSSDWDHHHTTQLTAQSTVHCPILYEVLCPVHSTLPSICCTDSIINCAYWGHCSTLTNFNWILLPGHCPPPL